MEINKLILLLEFPDIVGLKVFIIRNSKERYNPFDDFFIIWAHKMINNIRITA